MITRKRIIRILYDSLSQTIEGKLWKLLFGGSILHLLVTIFTTVELFHDAAPTISVPIILKVIGYFVLVLFMARYLLYAGQNMSHYLHDEFIESSYGDAIILLKETFAKVHSLRKKAEPITDEEFVDVLLCMCDNVKKIFDNKTKCVCSVSVKVPIESGDSLKINADHNMINLIRDSANQKKRDTAHYKNINHTISRNTAFLRIYNNLNNENETTFYYLNNNIRLSQNYDNSSKSVHIDGVLPYNCEIVYPIIPSFTGRQKKYEFLGYICVDCTGTGKFNEKYDPAILEGLADGFYDIFMARSFLKVNKGK